MPLKHLINYKEFIESSSETSNYPIPYAAIEWNDDDKIYNYVKSEIDKSPLWGIDLDKQEKKNKGPGNRKITESYKELNNIDIELTKHSKERSKERYGQKLNIDKKQIIDIVNATKDELIKFADKFETFVIHSLKSNLNIVGTLVKKGFNYVFRVITVMLKDRFFPKPNDKYIEIYEALINGDKFIVFGISKSLN